MSDISDESVGEVSVLKQSKRKRPETWQRNVRKAKRNKGDAYFNVGGKFVAARQVGPDCKCKEKCFDKVGIDNIKIIFDAFWAMESYDTQSSYLLNRVSVKPVKRSRVKDRESRRKSTNLFSVHFINTTIPVCKKAFLSIHGISEMRMRHVLVKFAASPTGTLTPDQRGRQEAVNKTSDELLDLVKHFCEALPTCQSHYSRKKNPELRYLPSGSTWLGLFKSFQDHLQEKGYDRNSLKFSRFIAKVREYKISIKSPKSDTCSVCDDFKVKMSALNPDTDIEELADLQVKKNGHHIHAEVGRKFLDTYSIKGQKYPGVVAIAVDLQQTLPTPRLTTSAQYYKCKLWTYNLGIHNLTDDHPYFYVWNESEAKRGSVEVASCINHFVNNYVDPEKVKKLIIFSDNCAGQNKNYNLVLFYLRLIHQNRFSSVHHYYLETGHSFLPCDRDFGVFEKHLKGKEVYSTDGYIELMKTCRTTDPVTVVRMTSTDFLGFDVLQKHATKAGQTQSGFKGARRLLVEDNYRMGITVSHYYGDFMGNIKWKLQKGRNTVYDPAKFDLSSVPLTPKFPNGVLLDAKKLDHIRSLTSYIPADKREFYTTLFDGQKRLKDLGADNLHDDDDPDDDLLDY